MLIWVQRGLTIVKIGHNHKCSPHYYGILTYSFKDHVHLIQTPKHVPTTVYVCCCHNQKNPLRKNDSCCFCVSVIGRRPSFAKRNSSRKLRTKLERSVETKFLAQKRSSMWLSVNPGTYLPVQKLRDHTAISVRFNPLDWRSNELCR